jgi:hypothetical protein
MSDAGVGATNSYACETVWAVQNLIVCLIYLL